MGAGSWYNKAWYLLQRKGRERSGGQHLLLATIDGAYPTLYVNATGTVSAEIPAPDGSVLPGFGFDNCTPTTDDDTCQAITFTGGNLDFLDGKVFRICFRVEDGALYSFWLSDEIGDFRGVTSAGYVADEFAE